RLGPGGHPLGLVDAVPLLGQDDQARPVASGLSDQPLRRSPVAGSVARAVELNGRRAQRDSLLVSLIGLTGQSITREAYPCTPAKTRRARGGCGGRGAGAR